MKHHIKGCLENNSPDSVILRVGNNNLKNKESVEDIAKDIMDMAIFITNEKSMNSLLKRRCDEEKMFCRQHDH